MKILLLSQFYSTTRGGGEQLFHTIANQLAEQDHKVWIITNRIKNESYQDSKNINIEFVPPELEYKGGLPPKFSDNFRFLFSSISRGLKIIKKQEIDLIHSNNFTPALAGGILSFLTSKPHVTSVWDVFSLCGEDYWNQWTKQMNVSKINGMIGPIFEKLIPRISCKAIHTISKATENDLKKFGTKKPIHVIEPSLENIPQRNFEPNSKQFVCVGRLIFYKNLEVVIKAINIVHKLEPDVKLIIVGDGPQKQQLQSIVKKLKLENNILFKSYVLNDEKMDIISKSNAMVFPSLCEGFGLVILEAFSQNRPVLVSNIKPMSDIVSDGKTGFVLEPHDENSWAKAMLKLVKEITLSKTMGKNGYDLLKSKYNPEEMTNKIISMYFKILR